jgi:hypothetical protein
LILTLNGPAIVGQIDVIYKYDQDTNSEIYIPYAYIENIDMIDKGFSFLMSKTFKTNQQFAFTIRPIPDAFGTNLCECQIKMFRERLMENYRKRTQILKYIVTQIVDQINAIKSIAKNIKRLENITIDKTKINTLRKRSTEQDQQCKTYTNSINTLNNKQIAKQKEFQEAKDKDIKALNTKTSNEKEITRLMRKKTMTATNPMEKNLKEINISITKLGEKLRNPPTTLSYMLKKSLETFEINKIKMDQITKNQVKSEIESLITDYNHMRSALKKIMYQD